MRKKRNIGQLQKDILLFLEHYVEFKDFSELVGGKGWYPTPHISKFLGYKNSSYVRCGLKILKDEGKIMFLSLGSTHYWRHNERFFGEVKHEC